MRYALKEFQSEAVCQLMNALKWMQEDYQRRDELSAICLSAPTGAGKTVISTAVIEDLFFGDEGSGIDADDKAVVLWISELPSLIEQTKHRMKKASDRISTSFMDERRLVTIGNTFCAGNDSLQPNTVYFLSKGLLASGNLLTRGSEENNGRVFWDVLDKTIRDGLHLYLFIDEAHRGIGASEKNMSDSASQTIYAKLIDGFEGRAPAPIVVGISATPERFQRSMESRPNRTLRPKVQIKPHDVQKSGLLKDIIELRVPDDKRPIDSLYLEQAVLQLVQSEKNWKDYCEQQNEQPVIPLLVVQVGEKSSKQHLIEICEDIRKVIPDLDPNGAFANVLGEHVDYDERSYHIRYVNPVDVQASSRIRVLFAKEAITTGWDCPRAEVIYSECHRDDPTYIAQLIGRMVRTPLGRRIESDGILNSVSCFLPRYNPEATQGVVKFLTNDQEGLGMEREQIISKSVEVVTFGGYASEEATPDCEDVDGEDAEKTHNSLREKASTPAQEQTSASDDKKHASVMVFDEQEMDGIQQAIDGLRVRLAQKESRNKFNTLVDVLSLMATTQLDTEADARDTRGFCIQLDAEIETYEKEFEEQRQEVENTNMHVVTLNMLDGEEVVTRTERLQADEEAIGISAKYAKNKFGSQLFHAYCLYDYENNGRTRIQTYTRLAAAAHCAPIFSELENWIEGRIAKHLNQHAVDLPSMKEEFRAEFQKLIESSRGSHDIPPTLIKNNRVNVMGRDGKALPRYDHHIIYDPTDGKMPLDLNKLEQLVVDAEFNDRKNQTTVAFYRNPPSASQALVAMPYSVNGKMHMLYPDFVFFIQDPDTGKIKPSIVDPHSVAFADTLPKLRGYVEYLKDYGDTFGKVQFVTDFTNSEETRYLDLLDPATQQAIVDFAGDSPVELFRGEHGHLYTHR